MRQPAKGRVDQESRAAKESHGSEDIISSPQQAEMPYSGTGGLSLLDRLRAAQGTEAKDHGNIPAVCFPPSARSEAHTASEQPQSQTIPLGVYSRPYNPTYPTLGQRPGEATSTHSWMAGPPLYPLEPTPRIDSTHGRTVGYDYNARDVQKPASPLRRFLEDPFVAFESNRWQHSAAGLYPVHSMDRPTTAYPPGPQPQWPPAHIFSQPAQLHRGHEQSALDAELRRIQGSHQPSHRQVEVHRAQNYQQYREPSATDQRK